MEETQRVPGRVKKWQAELRKKEQEMENKAKENKTREQLRTGKNSPTRQIQTMDI